MQERNELLEELFNENFINMSNKEFTEKLARALYQLFLIELDSINYTVDSDGFSTRINLNLSGECFVSGLDKSDITDMIADADIDGEDFSEGED